VADIVDSATRSRMMSSIRSGNTKPELLVRKYLFSKGYRFRIHVSSLDGKPDIVLRKYNAAVFVHGCFWHGHNCVLFKWPGTRKEFWKRKIETNKKNDKKAVAALRAKGWRVLVVWECTFKGRNRLPFDKAMNAIEGWLLSDNRMLVLKGKPRQAAR
jgi:DNA mismatch endonuclease (patch repair protein)